MRSLLLASLTLAALSGCALTAEPRFKRPYTVVAADSSNASDGSAQDSAMDASTDDVNVVGVDVVAMSDVVAQDQVVGEDVVEIGLDATAGDALVACAAPLTNCDDICVNTQNNPRNCGGCSRVCPSGPNSSPTCSGGMCALACAVGFGNCDGDPTNGCETPLGTPANCASCGGVCPGAPNAMPTCSMGTCGLTCRPGFGNCDGNASNGCESSLATSEHCGSCANRCSGANFICDAARSMCVPTGCTGGATYCPTEMACVNTTSDPRHCGSCGNICLSAPNSTPTCTGGLCGFACNTGFAECDGRVATVCETNTANDVNNCGGCGRVCSSCPGGRAVCVAGVCEIACDPGRLNCDRNVSNGCEAFALSNENCGRCANNCGFGAVCTSAAGSAPACVIGPLCSLTDNVHCGLACVDIETDARNCGSCNVACPSLGMRAGVCNGGQCFTCPLGAVSCSSGPNRGRCCTGPLGCAGGSCSPPV